MPLYLDFKNCFLLKTLYVLFVYLHCFVDLLLHLIWLCCCDLAVFFLVYSSKFLKKKVLVNEELLMLDHRLAFWQDISPLFPSESSRNWLKIQIYSTFYYRWIHFTQCTELNFTLWMVLSTFWVLFQCPARNLSQSISHRHCLETSFPIVEG